jgi:NAD(P)-dependent dehydrogenase (short-subunit alcohol dehydrogenase family)
MRSFKDKVAVITGAGSGIGQALAIELARAGAQLAISDINLENVAATAQQCAALGAKVKHYQLDCGNRDAIYAHADEVMRDSGKVHLLINNAGVAVNATVRELTDEDFHWLMNINFWGMVHGTKAFLPYLTASGDGHLVNISSIFGMIGVPKQSAYNAAKFAIRGFTEALRQELILEKAPVQVSCVHPGGIKTNIAKAARKGPSDADKDISINFENFARTTASQAANIILRGIKRNKPRIFVGMDAKVIDLLQRLLGAGYQNIVGPVYDRRMNQPAGATGFFSFLQRRSS